MLSIVRRRKICFIFVSNRLIGTGIENEVRGMRNIIKIRSKNKWEEFGDY